LSIIASVEVSEATRIILGEKPLLANKILYCDIGNLEFDKIEISKAENCPVCSQKPSGIPTPMEHRFITELCGREGKRVFVVTPKRNLELNMNELCAALRNNGFDAEVMSKLGVTFHKGLDKTVSVLRSGIMIIEGAKRLEEAYDLYNEIIIDELKVPRSTIE
jgi:adenylyltransferase/sulfurtransferase